MPLMYRHRPEYSEPAITIVVAVEMTAVTPIIQSVANPKYLSEFNKELNGSQKIASISKMRLRKNNTLLMLTGLEQAVPTLVVAENQKWHTRRETLPMQNRQKQP